MTVVAGTPRAHRPPLLVTVGLFRDPWHAHLFRMRLEAEGIPAFVTFQFHIGNNWLWSTALGGTRVQVWRRVAQDAIEVLDRVRSGEFHAELVELFGDIDDPRCPHCGSTHYRKRRPFWAIALTIMSLPIAPVPAWDWIYICRDCGREFEPYEPA
ncbi:MAG TPA: hypothetical protein VKB71_17975 [Rhizomicrobium sp.]|nr:hypothetical protein [Rhizomicrobium sp.]